MAEDDGAPPSGARRVLFIALGVVAAVGVLSCIACGVGGAFCATQIPASARPREPARVDAAQYYGTWTGAGPTSLTVDATNVRWEQQSGSGHVQYTGTFAGISGQDIRVGVVFTEVTLVVADPPHADASGSMVMTVEGVALTRQ